MRLALIFSACFVFFLKDEIDVVTYEDGMSCCSILDLILPRRSLVQEWYTRSCRCNENKSGSSYKNILFCFKNVDDYSWLNSLRLALLGRNFFLIFNQLHSVPQYLWVYHSCTRDLLDTYLIETQTLAQAAGQGGVILVIRVRFHLASIAIVSSTFLLSENGFESGFSEIQVTGLILTSIIHSIIETITLRA